MSTIFKENIEKIRKKNRKKKISFTKDLEFKNLTTYHPIYEPKPEPEEEASPMLIKRTKKEN